MKKAPSPDANNLLLIGIRRVSSAEQAADDRAGLDRQQTGIERIASRLEVPDNRLKVVTLIDVSGSDISRTPEWRTEVVPLLRDPNVHVAVDTMERLARIDDFDFEVLRVLHRTKTRIYTPTGVMDLKQPTDMLNAGMQGLMGGFFKAYFKQIVHGSKEEKRKKGEFPNSTICLATGVHFDHDTGLWSKTDEVVHPERAFRLFACSVRIEMAPPRS